MKLKTLSLVGGFLLGTLLTSCTGNQRAKYFGGNYTIELPKGRTLVTATWKGESLWILTRERKANETPSTYKFNEDSNYGVVEGTVTFIEE